MPQKLTPEIITAAIAGFEQQKHEIDTQIADLRAMLPGGNTHAAATPEATAPRRKRFSAAARRKMALAQKARWAKIRGESEPSPTATPEPAKPKRKLSAAGRKAISEATKKRWALKRAEAAKAKSAKSKKTAPAQRKAAVKKAAVKAPATKAAAKKRTPTKRLAAKTAPAAPATVQAAG